jgi:hypothetical protein
VFNIGTDFPFTSDPLRGIVAHLTEKSDGNVHDRGIVVITSKSTTSSSDLPKFAADFSKSTRFYSS